MNYLIINDGLVINKIDARNDAMATRIASSRGYIAVQNDTAEIGWSYDGAVFTPPNQRASARDGFTISLDKSAAAVGEIINAAVLYSLPNGGPNLSINNTYTVPVIRASDGKQSKFLTLSLTNGAGALSFSISEKGIFYVRLDMIDPRLSLELSDSPRIVVT